MTSISIRQLGKHVSACVRDVEEGNQPVIVLRDERPVAYIIPLDAAAELGLRPEGSEDAPAIPWRPKS